MKKQVMVISAVGLLLSGCSVVSKVTETATQKAQETAVEQAVKANCKFEAEVCEFLAGQTKSLSQAVTMTGTIGAKENKGMETITKMDGKGNMQALTMQNGKEQSNMIIFNNATYMKDYSDNQWFKMSEGKDTDNSLFNMKEMIEDMKTTFSEENAKLVVKKIGQESCGTLTCNKFEMYQEGETDKTIVWSDTKDNLTRKMETTAMGTTTTMTYTYGAVTISEPSPVKEFSMPKLPGLTEGTMPSAEDIKNMMKDIPQMEGVEE